MLSAACGCALRTQLTIRRPRPALSPSLSRRPLAVGAVGACAGFDLQRSSPVRLGATQAPLHAAAIDP